MSYLSPSLGFPVSVMRIEVFDVAHGFCAAVQKDDGRLFLMDCGHNDDTQFHPSNYLRQCGFSTIQGLFISNYDRDHFSDLPNLRSAFTIESLYCNRSISSSDLRQLKLQSGPIGVAMEALLEMIDASSGGGIATGSPLHDPSVVPFHNSYPVFEDTNNLSLVTFMHYRDIHIVFPGDLECAGWRQLLQNPSFRNELARTQIFVASHHGRENGYCPEVFEHCHPQIVIISDDAITYDTQEAVDYGIHAAGITFDDGNVRKVLTTRNDGKISIWQEPTDTTWYVRTQH